MKKTLAESAPTILQLQSGMLNLDQGNCHVMTCIDVDEHNSNSVNEETVQKVKKTYE